MPFVVKAKKNVEDFSTGVLVWDYNNKMSSTNADIAHESSSKSLILFMWY